MRVAILIDTWFPYWGGGQVNAWNASKRLVSSSSLSLSSSKKRRGVEIDIFTRKLRGQGGEVPPSLEEFENRKLRVFRLGPVAEVFNWSVRICWLFWVGVRMVVEHLRQPYDLVHAHAFSAILPGKILAMVLRKPLVITVHGVNVLETRPKSVMARVEKWLLTEIPAEVVISVQEHYRDFPSVKKNITVIPNGVDVAEYDRVKVAKSKVFKIVWVGRFDRVKGLEVLLRAVARLVEKDFVKGVILANKVSPGSDADLSSDSGQARMATGESKKVMEFEVHMIGGGGDVGYEKEMRRLVRELGLSRVVKFRGVITGREKIRELKSAYLFVLPSLSEGQPVTLLEAWVARLPVVVTAVGDNPRMVRDGVNGWLVKPGDEKGLAEVLSKAIGLPRSKLSEMGSKGYELVKKKYGWERAARETMGVYRRVLGWE